jgi:hypothetical protein
LLQVGDTGSVVSSSGANLEVTECLVAAGYVLHVADAAGAHCLVGESSLQQALAASADNVAFLPA